MSTWRAFFLGIFWTFLTTLIGLFPLWMKYFICILSEHPYHMDDIVREGWLMLFALTLVGAMLTDLVLIERGRMNLSPYVNAIIYILVPFLVFTFVAAAFSGLIKDPQSVNLKILSQMQIISFILALIYSFLIKFTYFLRGIV